MLSRILEKLFNTCSNLGILLPCHLTALQHWPDHGGKWIINCPCILSYSFSFLRLRCRHNTFFFHQFLTITLPLAYATFPTRPLPFIDTHVLSSQIALICLLSHSCSVPSSMTCHPPSPSTTLASVRNKLEPTQPVMRHCGKAI